MFPTVGRRLLVGSGILVTAVTGSFYAYFRSHQQLPSAPDGSSAGGTATFDAIASIYDAAIGQEEFYMGYGFLRGWLLKRYAQVGVPCAHACAIGLIFTCVQVD